MELMVDDSKERMEKKREDCFANLSRVVRLDERSIVKQYRDLYFSERNGKEKNDS